MMGFSDFWFYVTGPRLFRIFKLRESPGRQYVANNVEVFSDKVIQMFWFMRSILIYSSPIVITYLYRKGLISSDNNYLVFNQSFIRTATSFTLIYMSALLMRGISRSANTDYTSFAKILRRSKENDLSRLSLNKFDFEFNEWPIDFRWYESKMSETKKAPQLLSSGLHSRRQTFLSVPCDLISYAVVHTIGRPMLYPGSVSLLQYVLHPHLIEGRTRLVEQNGGERYKLLARDGNHIDCMLIDRRGSPHERAKTLVICSEGNAGFYEIGTMITPIEAGYSVLGWNHPGFGGSSGLPFPQNDINAIDVLIQFAVERLGFPMDSIMMLGWSIGGFPSTWAAMQYPDIKGIILDASFDDILPLAEAKMHRIIQPIVKNVILSYFNLNCSANLNHFNGPVLFIRRIRDEIIFTDPMEPFRTNRGNDLLTKLLHNRFPQLMGDENIRNVFKSWLLSEPPIREQIENHYHLNETICLSQLHSYLDSNGVSEYPVQIGDDPQMSSETKIELILFLAKKHLKDFDSTHCTPLPTIHFEEPFNLFANRNQKSNL